MSASPRDILYQGAAELGITLDDSRLDQFESFTSLLIEWNRKVNLTRITDPGEIAVKHYLDSLSLLSVIDIPIGSSVIDVGSGAGLPAIPLKIARPDLRVTILDSVRKRLLFVEAALQELGIRDAESLHARAEDAGRDPAYRERFDFVVSRAVARLAVLSELCVPFCTVGGWFVAYKGPDAGDEISEAGSAISKLGGRLMRTESLCLPGGDVGRTLVLIRKERETPAGYPRKAGIPQRDPL
jgi:16S rRNA (guanine527-N7)-methyltransferase